MSTQKLHTNRFAVQDKACLISAGNSGAQLIEIGDFLTMGRDPSNLLELADPYVSSRHARIEKKEDGFLIRDLRSQNGTKVNDNFIKEGYLNDGDRIQIGEREFLFQVNFKENPEDLRLKSKNYNWSHQLKGLPLFARTDLPVLLLGSSGTGKEVLARLTHDFSSRSNGPFVSVNCSALSETLIESELFGHIKGSFTGATHDRKGAFEAARGGTLFLDEIGDLPITLQPKLLRALENKEIRPVGSDRNIQTNVRIIAATHKNLQNQVAKNQFRSDLFYRLNVMKVSIPDLKDRMEDFEFLLYGFAREMRVRFSHEAIVALKTHNWPGNIRELKNVVARASALYPQQYLQAFHITALIDNLPTANIWEPLIKPTGRPMIKEIEKEMIIQKLIENKGNQRKTASDLGMPKSTLHDRIRSYCIKIDELLKPTAT